MSPTIRVITLWAALFLVMGGFIYFSSSSDHVKKDQETKVSDEALAAIRSNPTLFDAPRTALKATIYSKFAKETVRGISIDELSKNVYLVGVDLGDKTSNIICRSFCDNKGNIYWKIEEMDQSLLDLLNIKNKNTTGIK